MMVVSQVEAIIGMMMMETAVVEHIRFFQS